MSFLKKCRYQAPEPEMVRPFNAVIDVKEVKEVDVKQYRECDTCMGHGYVYVINWLDEKLGSVICPTCYGLAEIEVEL